MCSQILSKLHFNLINSTAFRNINLLGNCRRRAIRSSGCESRIRRQRRGKHRACQVIDFPEAAQLQIVPVPVPSPPPPPASAYGHCGTCGRVAVVC